MRNCILIFISLFIVQTVSSQYNIEFNIKPLSNDTVILAHYLSKSFSVQDTSVTDENGKVVFSGKNSLPQGLYIVYISPSLRFDIIVGEDQEFTVKTDTTNFINNTSVSGSNENQYFFEYQHFIAERRSTGANLQERLKKPVSIEDSTTARLEFDKINLEVKDFTEKLIDRSKGLFISKFLLSLKDVVPPPSPLNETGDVIDPAFQVKYIKHHYWDFFDLSDVRLLRTPIYEDKLKNYLENWIYPVPDSIFEEVDFLIEKSRSDSLLFRYMLTTLFNHYARSKFVGMDAIFIYIAEKYYIPEATWADKKFKEDLKERVIKQSPLLLGKIAPDVQLVWVDDDHFKVAAIDTSIKKDPYAGELFNLHSIKAKYIVLYFWEPECGHCKKVIPELHQVFLRNKDKGLQVIAINILGYPKKDTWVDFINQHNLFGWINAWNPYNTEPSYRDLYNIESSNILYLLDVDKKIIVKFIGPEQVEEIINNEMK